MLNRLRLTARISVVACAILFITLTAASLAGEPDPIEDLDARKTKSISDDPFSDLEAKSGKSEQTQKPEDKKPTEAKKSLLERVFTEQVTFKKELYFQLSYSDEKDRESNLGIYNRHSVGFEIYKRFASKTATLAAFDFQGRLVRRDNYFDITNNMGEARDGWSFEVHNAYLDFYNVFNSVLGSEARGANIGRFNVRIGHFYLPLGINLQTDTHGTIMQLSNDRNLGFERDWYAGMWGSVNADVNYDIYYLLGSGTDLSFKGQKGLVGARFSLANKYRNEFGIEAGLGFLFGERISKQAVKRSPSVAADADNNAVVDTVRFGPDWRYTRLVPTGSLSLTGEISIGQDESDRLITQLYQLDYLNRSRKWGLSAQYRRFWQGIGRGNVPSGEAIPRSSDASLFGEFTWYFRNDIGGTNYHWIKLNVEHQLERQDGNKDTIIMLQYYRYW